METSVFQTELQQILNQLRSLIRSTVLPPPSPVVPPPSLRGKIISGEATLPVCLQLRTTKVNKFVDRFIETGRDFLKVRKPSE